MPVPIRMPALSDGMQEGKVVAWPHALGAAVDKGAVVLVIEADKSEVDVEAPLSGFVRHYYVHPGTTVRCGTLLGLMTTTADEPIDPIAYEIEDSTAF